MTDQRNDEYRPAVDLSGKAILNKVTGQPAPTYDIQEPQEPRPDSPTTGPEAPDQSVVRFSRLGRHMIALGHLFLGGFLLFLLIGLSAASDYSAYRSSTDEVMLAATGFMAFLGIVAYFVAWTDYRLQAEEARGDQEGSGSPTLAERIAGL